MNEGNKVIILPSWKDKVLMSGNGIYPRNELIGHKYAKWPSIERWLETDIYLIEKNTEKEVMIEKIKIGLISGKKIYNVIDIEGRRFSIYDFQCKDPILPDKLFEI